MLVTMLVDPRVEEQDAMTVYTALHSLVSNYDSVLDNQISIQNLGPWRTSDYVDGKEFVPYKSINWFLETAYLDCRMQNRLSAGSLVSEGQGYSLRNKSPFVVFVVNDELHHNENGWMMGATRPFWCSVISVFRFQNYAYDLKHRLIRTLTMHESGHLFGSTERNFGVEESIGKHCLNHTCVMRQGASLYNWVSMANFLKNDPFPYCYDCQSQLYNNIIRLQKSRDG